MKYTRKSVQAMEGYVPGEQPAGTGLVKLNTNENPYPPAPAVGRALATMDPLDLSRYPDPVSLALRQRIAELHGCETDQVVVGNGSDELLALATRAFVERDASVSYFEPSYSLYPVLCAVEDVKTVPVPLNGDFGWQAPGEDSSLFFLTNPNAPTSMLFPRQEVEAFCKRFSGVVVIDEAYVDFSDADCMDLALACENVLVARSLSKSYSLAGIRLGYAVGSRELVASLMKIKDSYNINMSTQQLGLAALGDVEHMRKNVDKICATRQRVTGALEALGFEVAPSQTNFLWTKHPEVSSEQLFSGLREAQVLVRHFSGEATAPYLRVTVGTDSEMDIFLATLKSLLIS